MKNILPYEVWFLNSFLYGQYFGKKKIQKINVLFTENNAFAKRPLNLILKALKNLQLNAMLNRTSCSKQINVEKTTTKDVHKWPEFCSGPKMLNKKFQKKNLFEHRSKTMWKFKSFESKWVYKERFITLNFEKNIARKHRDDSLNWILKIDKNCFLILKF